MTRNSHKTRFKDLQKGDGKGKPSKHGPQNSYTREVYHFLIHTCGILVDKHISDSAIIL